uniref:TF-B3 domain-containing protein n=1 Tax=Cucumis sativus TaxID=3659 RepID=A0A0A0KI50_CUCSA
MMSHSGIEPASNLEFFKVFLPGSCTLHMSIPPAFMKHLNGTFPEKATMQDHTGNSWCITLEKLDDLLYFKNGWKAFVDYHSLKYGDFLVFQYHGHCLFDVKIFGKNGCKKAAAAKPASSIPVLETEIAEAGNSVSDSEAKVADAGNSIANLEAMSADAGNSDSKLEVVEAKTGNAVPTLKVKEEPVVEEEDVKPSISHKRKRLQDGSELDHQSKSVVPLNRGRPDNVSNSVEQAIPRGPFFERTMKRWSGQILVEEPLHYMPFFGRKNFRIEPVKIFPVRTNPEVAKYFEECNQFQEYSWEMLMSHVHSLSANQELKYIQFEHEEVDSQQNYQYFQDDDVQDNQSEGLDMIMTDEQPISQSEEILYLEYQPLQTDIEDNRKSANMDSTELVENSYDIEQNNMDDTSEVGGNLCDNIKENNVDTTELSGNSYDNIKENNMDTTELGGNLCDNIKENNVDSTEHCGNLCDNIKDNNVDTTEEKQSPASVEPSRKKKKRKSASFEVQEQKEETSEIDTDQDSRRGVETRQRKKIAEQSKKQGEDGKRKKRGKRGKKSGISGTSSEHDDEVDVHKEYPLLLPRSSWATTQRINLYSKLDVISIIKNTLNERQLKKFKKSCFGNFLDLKISKFSSQLFYHLIRRQCCSKNRNELWFNLEGRIHKFGMKDFALITGLNCGELPAIDMSKIQKGKFNKRYFGGEKTIRRAKLHKVFTEMDKGRNKDVVKMAKLYILEMFILGKQIRTGINHEYTLLIDDKKQFDSYPWGRISYEITVDFVKKSIKSNDASAIGVGGFPYALLVWAYETIPLLALNSNFLAMRISFGTPRMNNWAAGVHPEWKDLSEKVFQSEAFDVQPLIATTTEMEMPYMIPFGGVKPSNEKNISPVDQEHNSDARTSYNKDHCNWKGSQSVSKDGVENFLFTKIVNIEGILGSLVHDIDNLKSFFHKMCGTANEAADSEKMRKPL